MKKVTPTFHGEFFLASDSHPAGLFLLREIRDLAAAVIRFDVSIIEMPDREEHLYLLPRGVAPAATSAVSTTVVVEGALVTLVIRSHIEARGHFSGEGDDHNLPLPCSAP